MKAIKRINKNQKKAVLHHDVDSFTDIAFQLCRANIAGIDRIWAMTQDDALTYKYLIDIETVNRHL